MIMSHNESNIVYRSDDSEDDIGRKVYKPEHDEILYKLLDEKEKHERDFAEK